MRNSDLHEPLPEWRNLHRSGYLQLHVQLDRLGLPDTSLQPIMPEWCHVHCAQHVRMHCWLDRRYLLYAILPKWLCSRKLHCAVDVHMLYGMD